MRGELRIENRKSKMSNRFAGFTLTEVIMASVLLIIALVPILQALTSSHATGTIIERKTRSLMLARAKLDEIKARSIYNYSSSFTEANTPLDGSYLCKVTDDGAASDLRQIKVAVGYDLNGSSTLEAHEVDITLSTLVARRW